MDQSNLLINDTLTISIDNKTINSNNDTLNDDDNFAPSKLFINLTTNSLVKSSEQLISSSKLSHDITSVGVDDIDDDDIIPTSLIDDTINSNGLPHQLNSLPIDSSTISINIFNFSPFNYNSSSTITSSSSSVTSSGIGSSNSLENQFIDSYNDHVNYNSTSLINILSNSSSKVISSSFEDLTSHFLPNLPPTSTGPECAAHHDITSLDVSTIQFPGNYSKVLEAEYSYIEYIKITFTIAVIIAALTGNIGIILAISLHRSLRTTINYYLVNLAIADIFICTFCMSVYLINHLTEPLFILGPIVCKLNAFCQSKYSFFFFFLFLLTLNTINLIIVDFYFFFYYFFCYKNSSNYLKVA